MGLGRAAPLLLLLASSPVHAEETPLRMHDSGLFASGTVLTTVGVTALGGGVAMLVDGLVARTCWEPTSACSETHPEMKIIGPLAMVGASAALAGGVLMMTHGLRREAPHARGVPIRMHDGSMVATGVGLTVVGTAGLVGGFLVFLVGLMSRGCMAACQATETEHLAIGPALMVGAAAEIGAGIWMIAHGARQTPASITVGVGNVRLTW